MVMPTANDLRISSGGLVNDTVNHKFYIANPVYYGGTAVLFDTAHALDEDGNMWVKHASSTDRPIGITLMSTVDANVPTRFVTASHFLSSVPVPVRRFIEGELISVPLVGDHAQLAVGDKLGISASGEFDKFSSISGCVYSIAIVMDALAAGTGADGAAGYNAECVRCRVQITKEL